MSLFFAAFKICVEAKSKAEIERYTVEKCALEAKFMREAAPATATVHVSGNEN